MQILRIIFLLAITSVLISCDNDSENDAEFTCLKGDPGDKAVYNLKRKWEFLGFFQQDTNTERCKPGSFEEMNIEFNSRNRFHAASSCNILEGYYSTKKKCYKNR